MSHIPPYEGSTDFWIGVAIVLGIWTIIAGAAGALLASVTP